jgi:hypothetical protein
MRKRGRNWLPGRRDVNTDDSLIAIKALFLGYAAAASLARRHTVLAMVQAAVEFLASKRDQEPQRRLAFYHLVRAELLRHDGDPLHDRSEAQRLCIECRSTVFIQFMRLQEVDLGDPLEFPSSADMIDLINISLDHLDVLYSQLNEAHVHFLTSVPLLDILRCHHIPFTE